LTEAVRVAHVAVRAFSATCALRTFGLFADSLCAAVAPTGAVVVTRASSPKAVEYVYGILGPLLAFNAVLWVWERWGSGTADEFASVTLEIIVLQVDQDCACDGNS
jgi:hypothetical protein